MVGAPYMGVLVALYTIITQPSRADFLPAARGATGMVDVMVHQLMPWAVNFEDEACYCCVTKMMTAIAVDRAGGAPFSL